MNSVMENDAFKNTTPENDEAANAEYFIAWRDLDLDANIWWGLSRVAPYDAAMLLCYLNPRGTFDPKAVTNDETGPDDFKRLLLVFNDVAEADKADPKPRTLRQWHTIAHDKGLKHHSWIDKYQKARLLIERDSPAAAIEPSSAQEQDMSEVQEGGAGSWKGKTQEEIASTHKLTREDALSLELYEILKSMANTGDRITAIAVMPKLQKEVRTEGSCIVDFKENQVIWENAKGTTKTLTIPALQKRIDNWKKRR